MYESKRSTAVRVSGRCVPCLGMYIFEARGLSLLMPIKADARAI